MKVSDSSRDCRGISPTVTLAVCCPLGLGIYARTARADARSESQNSVLSSLPTELWPPQHVLELSACRSVNTGGHTWLRQRGLERRSAQTSVTALSTALLSSSRSSACPVVQVQYALPNFKGATPEAPSCPGPGRKSSAAPSASCTSQLSRNSYEGVLERKITLQSIDASSSCRLNLL